MQKPAIVLEHARPGDLPAILDILNHYIRTDHCIFDTEPWTTADKQAWFGQFSGIGPHRLLVARQDECISGYAHSGPWRPKKAYEVTVETTVYVHPDHLGRGFGHKLLGSLLEQLQDCPVHSAVAGIAQPNPASNHLHQALGFREVGTYREVGFKFDRYWDVTWYQKLLA